MPKSPKETEYQKLIKTYMETNGFLVLRIPPSIYTNMKGLPDLVCIKEGFHVWIEVKKPKGKLSKKQEEVISKMREAGALVLISYGFNEEALAEVVAKVDKMIKLLQKKLERGKK